MAKEKQVVEEVIPVSFAIMSERKGDVILSDGKVIRYQDVVKVDKETFDWLKVTFGDQIREIRLPE
jgi:hypothetical protein